MGGFYIDVSLLPEDLLERLMQYSRAIEFLTYLLLFLIPKQLERLITDRACEQWPLHTNEYLVNNGKGKYLTRLFRTIARDTNFRK